MPLVTINRPGRTVRVVRYKGDRKCERGIERMLRDGWTVDAHTTRKAYYGALAGVFTRKQIHTVTYRREPGN